MVFLKKQKKKHVVRVESHKKKHDLLTTMILYSRDRTKSQCRNMLYYFLLQNITMVQILIFLLNHAAALNRFHCQLRGFGKVAASVHVC